jgi:YidC/Oxa1 family membrane protein insertase
MQQRTVFPLFLSFVYDKLFLFIDIIFKHLSFSKGKGSMDKRTILFVIGLSLTLFLVNLFFQYQNVQKKQEWLKLQKAKEVQKEKSLEEEIAQRTASLSTLPLIELYGHAQDQTPLALGIFNHENLLSLSWTSHLPTSVFARAPDSSEMQEYHLTYQEPGLGSPVIYQAKASDRLQVGQLPSTGHYDLQLVTFDSQDPLKVDVILGEYIDGHLNLPQPGNWQALHTLVPLNEMGHLAQFISQATQGSVRSVKKTEEKFYVLETPYQQLVFSNYGGSLAEINLPFHSKNHSLSVVREIEFDREMIQEHPYNAYFPAHPYYTPPSSTQKEAEFHEQGKLGGYYPLLRRDLIEKSPRQSIRVKPQFYALNITSEYPELAEMVYEVKHFDDHSITFEAVQQHRRITKTFALGDSKHPAGPYCLDLEIKIEGDGRGLWLTSGVPEVEWISGSIAPSLKYRLTRHQKSEVEKIDLPKDSTTVSSIYLDWICNSNGFLGMIMDSLKEIDPGYRVQYVSGLTAPSRLVEFDETNDRFKPANLPGYMTLLPLKSQGGAMRFRFFAGPFDTAILKEVDALYADPATNYNPDYMACQTMHGWFTFISEPFAKFLFILMNLFHSFTGSWALSIVLLTISLRLMLYPLNAWSTKSMVRMQQISPEIAAIQEKYKKDPKKAQIEIMNLYRERGINPASGCLPLLIQMPFLIGMFDLLKSSFALRGAPFIPGWIDDLTAPDVLFRWKYSIFFIGNEFHLLPILLGVVMFVQQRLMATGPQDPNLMTDQQRQQRMMGTMMTVLFTVMFYNFPSGLNIYWLSSMLLGILQQWITTKKMQKKPIAAPVPVKPGTKKGKPKKV